MADKKITYRYTAQDREGKKVKGSLEALTEARAYAQLKSLGLVAPQLTALQGGLNTEIKIPGIGNKPNAKAMSLFANQFGTLIKAGMPLIKALKVCAEQTDDSSLKKALQAVYTDVESGMSLASAMEKQPEAFSPLVVNLVRVGETGGFLDTAFISISKNMKSEAELRAKVKSAMVYPIVVGSIAVIAVFIMLIFIIPVFADMFAQMDSELPAITQMLITFSENSLIIVPTLLVLGGGIVYGYNKVKHKESVRARVDPIKLKIPVFGKLAQKVAIARFSQNLSMMVSSGVHIVEALVLVSGTMNNYVMESAIADVVKSVKKGRGMAEPLSEYEIFPPMVTQMIAVGEEVGSLSPMLNTVAEFYEEEVKVATESLSSALEPAMIVILGGVIGGMLVAMYLPMFSMFTEMSAQ